jgi:hypothetical protein
LFISVGLAVLLAYWNQRVDRLLISRNGVSYGSEHWNWSAIGAIGFFLTDGTHPKPHVRIWQYRSATGKHGSGRVLAIDAPIPRETEEQLITVIQTSLGKSVPELVRSYT